MTALACWGILIALIFICDMLNHIRKMMEYNGTRLVEALRRLEKRT